jgi:hypothetical protein
MDFTVDLYTSLLTTLKVNRYTFLTVKDFNLHKSNPKLVVLRHDVDKSPQNSLIFACIQNQKGVTATYYFRSKQTSFNKQIILEIASLGHEVGYHYETLDTCNGSVDKAYNEFCRNLDMFRRIVPVETICMHGSPFSKYDNRLIWEKYDYKKLGIIAEPYFDIDFNKVYYITDTGRRWDGGKVNIRDKHMQQTGTQWPAYHSTFDIIKALSERTFPKIAMMTFHPQRWTNNQFLWIKELLAQNFKNQIKKFLVK